MAGYYNNPWTGPALNREQGDPYSSVQNDIVDAIFDKIPGLRMPRREMFRDQKSPSPLARSAAAERNENPFDPAYTGSRTYDPSTIVTHPGYSRAIGAPGVFSREEETADAEYELGRKDRNMRDIDAEIANTNTNKNLDAVQRQKILAILNAERGNIQSGTNVPGGVPAQPQAQPVSYAASAPAPAPPGAQAGFSQPSFTAPAQIRQAENAMPGGGGQAAPDNRTPGMKHIEELRAEIDRLIEEATNAKPMYSPEEAAARQQANQNMLQYGAWGEAANIAGTRSLGKALTAQALADQKERVTDHGLFEPLSGTFKFMPGWQQSKRAELLQKSVEALTKVEEIEAYKNLGLPAGISRSQIGKDQWINPATQRIEAQPGSKLFMKQSEDFGAEAKRAQGSANFAYEQARLINQLLTNPEGMAQIFTGSGALSDLSRATIAKMGGKPGAAMQLVQQLENNFQIAGTATARALIGQSLGQMTQQEWPKMGAASGALSGMVPMQEVQRQLIRFRDELLASANMDRVNFSRTWRQTPHWDRSAETIGAPIATEPAPSATGEARVVREIK